MSLSDARQKIIEHHITASANPAATKESTTLSAVLETLATFQNPLIPQGGLEALINDICIEDLSFLAQKLDNYLLRPFSSVGGRTPQPSEASSIGDVSLRSSQTRRNRRVVRSVRIRDRDTCTITELPADNSNILEAAHILPFKLSQESDTVIQFICKYIPMGPTFFQMLDCAENMLMLNMLAHHSFGGYFWYIRCGNEDEFGQRVYTSNEAEVGSGFLNSRWTGKSQFFTDPSGVRLEIVKTSNGQKMLIGPKIEGGASQPGEKYCVIHELICRMLVLRGGAEPEWLEEEDDDEEYDDNVKNPPFLMPERVDIDAKVRKYLESMDSK